ncbi:MAG: glycosyltransferase [Pseudomonadota bacterium]
MPRKIGVVLKGYPRLSETFIAQELLALERAGLTLNLISLRHPTDKKRHPVHEEIKAPVNYLPEYLHQEPLRVLRGWWRARKLPGYKRVRRIWLQDLKRDLTRNRVRRFGQALVLAAELESDIEWLYGHFIHTPGSVTRYAAQMHGLPFSFSAHAKDIWTSPDWELNEKLNDARWTATCTAGGANHLKSLADSDDAVALIYHGLDLSRFDPTPVESSGRTGGKDAPIELVTVGRAVEKKGLDTLIEALSKLPLDLHWRWTHIGGGPLLSKLKTQVETLNLQEKVAFRGALPQVEVLETYRRSDLFVLPCRIAADGDRDGLPNVIVEAESQGLPCISTPISGIPELIDDGVNGLLVPPDDPGALAGAIEQLSRDPQLRHQFGRAGQERVERDFNAANEIKALLALFGEAPVTIPS